MRRYHPRFFGLLFAANELQQVVPPVSHFIEGSLFQEDGAQLMDCAGRAEVRTESAPPKVVEYENIADLAARLPLDQAGVNVFVGRVTSTINKS